MLHKNAKSYCQSISIQSSSPNNMIYFANVKTLCSQIDTDGDLFGDPCDTNVDKDKDGVEDTADNCPLISNPEQKDADFDGVG